MKQSDNREVARRQHRSIALFAVIQCWLRNLDGLVIDRKYLERLTGIDRFTQTRIEWLQKDFYEFFKFRKVIPVGSQPLGSLYVSRRKLEGVLPGGTMSDEKRVAGAKEAGLRLGLFKIWLPPFSGELTESAVPFIAGTANTDESILTSYLALLAAGQISPRSLPFLERGSVKK